MPTSTLRPEQNILHFRSVVTDLLSTWSSMHLKCSSTVFVTQSFNYLILVKCSIKLQDWKITKNFYLVNLPCMFSKYYFTVTILYSISRQSKGNSIVLIFIPKFINTHNYIYTSVIKFENISSCKFWEGHLLSLLQMHLDPVNSLLKNEVQMT